MVKGVGVHGSHCARGAIIGIQRPGDQCGWGVDSEQACGGGSKASASVVDGTRRSGLAGRRGDERTPVEGSSPTIMPRESAAKRTINTFHVFQRLHPPSLRFIHATPLLGRIQIVAGGQLRETTQNSAQSKSDIPRPKTMATPLPATTDTAAAGPPPGRLVQRPQPRA